MDALPNHQEEERVCYFPPRPAPLFLNTGLLLLVYVSK